MLKHSYWNKTIGMHTVYNILIDKCQKEINKLIQHIQKIYMNVTKHISRVEMTSSKWNVEQQGHTLICKQINMQQSNVQRNAYMGLCHHSSVDKQTYFITRLVSKICHVLTSTHTNLVLSWIASYKTMQMYHDVSWRSSRWGIFTITGDIQSSTSTPDYLYWVSDERSIHLLSQIYQPLHNESYKHE